MPSSSPTVEHRRDDWGSLLRGRIRPIKYIFRTKREGQWGQPTLGPSRLQTPRHNQAGDRQEPRQHRSCACVYTPPPGTANTGSAGGNALPCAGDIAVRDMHRERMRVEEQGKPSGAVKVRIRKKKERGVGERDEGRKGGCHVSVCCGRVKAKLEAGAHIRRRSRRSARASRAPSVHGALSPHTPFPIEAGRSVRWHHSPTAAKRAPYTCPVCTWLATPRLTAAASRPGGYGRTSRIHPRSSIRELESAKGEDGHGRDNERAVEMRKAAVSIAVRHEIDAGVPLEDGTEMEGGRGKSLLKTVLRNGGQCASRDREACRRVIRRPARGAGADGEEKFANEWEN
ncbi:hypothetical protein C8R44DRAFT_740453 [Mycena epipterygia]|nr:hypothetical protein C8R44DRAFT_740453 [Mycena epipterygia]